MGSVGPDFRCPLRGIKAVGGYSPDGIDFPLCSTRPRDRQHYFERFSCLDRILQGVSINGIRAGAIYKIVSGHVGFMDIFDANPNFFLEVSDLLFGKDRPTRGEFARYRYWHEAYVPYNPAPRNMMPGTVMMMNGNALPRNQRLGEMNVSPHDPFWNTTSDSSGPEDSQGMNDAMSMSLSSQGTGSGYLTHMQ